MAAIQNGIIIFGRSVAEHDVRLQQVFQTIEKSGLKLNEKKCEIGKPKIFYFGNVVNKEGMSPDPDKVKAIQELSAPNNVPELHQVLGMINYSVSRKIGAGQSASQRVMQISHLSLSNHFK